MRITKNLANYLSTKLVEDQSEGVSLRESEAKLQEIVTSVVKRTVPELIWGWHHLNPQYVNCARKVYITTDQGEIELITLTTSVPYPFSSIDYSSSSKLVKEHCTSFEWDEVNRLVFYIRKVRITMRTKRINLVRSIMAQKSTKHLLLAYPECKQYLNELKALNSEKATSENL